MRNFAAANKRRTDMNEFISRLHKSFRHHPVLFNILLAFVAILMLIWFTLIFLDSWTHHGETSVVPDVKYMDYRKAISTLSDNNLEIEVNDSVYITDLAESLRKNSGVVAQSGRGGKERPSGVCHHRGLFAQRSCYFHSYRQYIVTPGHKCTSEHGYKQRTFGKCTLDV